MKKSVGFVFLMLVLLMTSLGCSVPSSPLPPTSTPGPTSTLFVMPAGDFKMSWNIYNSEYNPSGAILTIRRQGATILRRLYFLTGLVAQLIWMPYPKAEKLNSLNAQAFCLVNI